MKLGKFRYVENQKRHNLAASHYYVGMIEVNGGASYKIALTLREIYVAIRRADRNPEDFATTQEVTDGR